MKKFLSYTMLMLLLVAGVASADSLFNWSQNHLAPQANPTVIKTVTTDYTVLTSDKQINCNTASAAITVTLLPIKSTGNVSPLVIKNTGTTGRNVTVTASTTDSVTNTIEGQSSRIVPANSIMYISVIGSDWKVSYETAPLTVDMATGNVASLNGPVTGPAVYSAQTATTVTITYADCGKVISMGTGTTTFSLPATKAGCEYTFVNAVGGAAAPMTVDPVAADNIYGGCTLASSVVTIDDTAGDGVINTAATAVKGDFIRLMGDGDVGWFITGCQGIWAEL